MTKKIVIISLSCLALALGGVVWLFVAFYVSMERGEEHRRQLQAEQRSGKWDFGDQPALSLGADPNYTNGHRNSFALANAVHGSALLLRYMLEAGGDPNTRDEFGQPIILMNWYLGYYKNDARARLDLLLDHGADINATMPERESEFDGYTLLLYRTEMGPRYSEYGEAYADALYLLERGADPNRAAADGMTFPKMLMKHRQQFRAGKRTPPEFEALWEWAQTHGILHWPE